MKTAKEIKVKLEFGRQRLAEIERDTPGDIQASWKMRAQIETLKWVLKPADAKEQDENPDSL